MLKTAFELHPDKENPARQTLYNELSSSYENRDDPPSRHFEFIRLT
ncbi:hypothetical protein EMIT013CA1_130055 [Bacillus sp. IT-13CA1]